MCVCMARKTLTGFKSVQLFKDQTLGIGSYGKVCRAKCDDLLCAAKLIHETLFHPLANAPQREHRLPMRRFEQECEFLSTIRHPNIVQYLGIYRDPDTDLPALLMELMDDSLTNFLESSPQPIPYHVQVNICHDITLALSYLHSNGIIHRDLSSNNVLLISNVRAKVTDFGMASLDNQNPQATQLTFTMCPGTDVYMPPEAVKETPGYTEKIDCFSFGVLAIQIVTQLFPKPGDRRKEIQIHQPGLLSIVEVTVSEIERRQNHICEINPNHSLLKVALSCLNDRDVERPSARQLCEKVAILKESPQYSVSVREVETSSAEQGKGDERDRELASLREQHSEQIQGLQQIIQLQMNHLVEKDQIIGQKDLAMKEKEDDIAELQQQIQQLGREKDVVIEEIETQRELRCEIVRLERQLGGVNQQLEKSKQVIAQFQRRIAELEQLISTTDASSGNKEQRAGIKLTWREGEKAPCSMSSLSSATVDGNTLYVGLTGTCQVFSYTIYTSSSWSQLPDSPTSNGTSVIVNNLLTLVGGDHCGTPTNQLFSLTGEGSGRRWTEEFPPMPTKRWGSSALCTRTALIVAGGVDKSGSPLLTVEVLNTKILQWSTAAELPQSLSSAPATVCGDQVYILGKFNMFTCSLPTLVQSRRSFLASIWNRGTRVIVWKEVAAPPVTLTNCVSIHGHLLAIGGMDSNMKPSSAIHLYNPVTDSWEVISHMGMPRYSCIAVVLPNNQLIVVGGCTSTSSLSVTDSVELATVE